MTAFSRKVPVWLVWSVWSVGLAILISPCRAAAQDSSVIHLIPAERWKLSNVQNSDVNQVGQWGGDPAIETEYGVKSVTERTYRFDDTDDTVQAIFEETADATSAYGLFTYYRTQDMKPDSGVPLSASGAHVTLMARGPFFIRILGPGTGVYRESGFRALLTMVGGRYSAAELSENLGTFLPMRGLIPGSAKYLLGPNAAGHVVPSFPAELIGFKEGAEAEVGTYVESAGSKGTITLLVINYPTPQMARAQFEIIDRALGVDQNREHGAIRSRLRGPFVLVVVNAPSKLSATRFLDEFSVAKQFSRDARYPGQKSFAGQVVELLIANAILILVVIGFSIVGGFAVFLLKRLTRKWFPQWAFVEGEEAGITTLKLS